MLYPSGNAGYASVGLGNILAWRSLLLCLYAACLGCRFVLEQLNGTALNVHPAFGALRNHIFWGRYGALVFGTGCTTSSSSLQNDNGSSRTTTRS